jgi:hypothetical protein
MTLLITSKEKQTRQHRVAQQANKINMPLFKVGDKVLLRNENATKLNSLWSGPYTIVEADNNGLNIVIATTKISE